MVVVVGVYLPLEYICLFYFTCLFCYSAGLGRSGTFIAIDMGIQQVNLYLVVTCQLNELCSWATQGFGGSMSLYSKVSFFFLELG